MSDLSYQDLIENNKLLQEILNEENAELAAENPIFAKEHEAIGKALQILVDAEVPTLLFAETHISDHKPYMQYNNFVAFGEKKGMIGFEKAMHSHESWFKVFRSFANYVGQLYPTDKPHVAIYKAMMLFYEYSLEEWMKLGQEKYKKLDEQA